MEISTLFKDSLKYPLKDYRILLILGVITVVSNLSSLYNGFGGYADGVVSSVLSIIGLIASFVLAGYLLAIVKTTIEGSDVAPEFSWKENFVMGIKYLVLNIIYLIIPIVIVLLVAFATGVFSSAETIINAIGPTALNSMAATGVANQTALANVPNSALSTLGYSVTITAIVGIVLAILFTLFFCIAQCRLAITGRVKEGLKIKEVFNDISAIGWGSFIIWFIVLVIIMFIIIVISGFVSMIPYVGAIIASLIIAPFLTMFMSRALGLVYLNK